VAPGSLFEVGRFYNPERCPAVFVVPGLIPEVSKNVRWVAEDLARKEQQHYDMLTELAAQPEFQAQVEAEIATPASDGRFSDAVHIPDLRERPDDQAVLQYAMGREHLAMEQYRSLAGVAEPGALNLETAVDRFEWLVSDCFADGN